jgi:hypothetical protein
LSSPAGETNFPGAAATGAATGRMAIPTSRAVRVIEKILRDILSSLQRILAAGHLD